MDINVPKKDLTTETKKELKKSRLVVLTKENDFFSKNPQEGWIIR